MVVVKVVLSEKMNEKNVKTIIRKHCKTHLEKYKQPVKIIFEDRIDFTSRFKKIRK